MSRDSLARFRRKNPLNGISTYSEREILPSKELARVRSSSRQIVGKIRKKVYSVIFTTVVAFGWVIPFLRL